MSFTAIGYRSVGMTGRILDRGLSNAGLARRPPKNRPNLSLLYPQICGQGAYSSCIQVRDLAAQIAARSLPSIYDYCL